MRGLGGFGPTPLALPDEGPSSPSMGEVPRSGGVGDAAKPPLKPNSTAASLVCASGAHPLRLAAAPQTTSPIKGEEGDRTTPPHTPHAGNRAVLTTNWLAWGVGGKSEANRNRCVSLFIGHMPSLAVPV